ncbi:flagellar basal-body rod modification protein FlgD [Trichlorobacter thiogenes]|uniref:Basal-body rod modification protein FlgD n=1 Tax=Trichlorobacter thiogenes TaxID=115783 RepID=A0A1T4JTK5_9BACT|nr:FlgD immunoglobulin-like domain containing protein [Trichlorobacter thiogenes]SJZ33542.1 flagellar basal-body rod modification protein FlgD [Trichlorobacter thiogenes]
MTTAVTSTTSTTTSTAAAAMKQELGMNKDDFLKLFIAQLQNQDPLSPQDPTEMLGQLAQLTQVEQAYNTTTALNNLLSAQNNNLALSSVGLIGKDIVALGSQLNFDGTNSVELSYQMPSGTTATTLTIKDASGTTIRTIDLGAQAAGKGTYAWDGTDGQGNQLSAGAYSFSISGTDAAGATQTATTFTTGRADGVTFAEGVAYITIGSVLVPFSDVMRVSTT